jgi:murein DD-endopeptidase MepM/ murein hydrolase activator NlpD
VNGVRYAHYHDGVDIAAPLNAPVAAAAPGQVIFVGHIADGAEIVLIAHIGGYVSEYGHLADGVAAPTVRAGDFVRAGDVIGRIGMTGITTGAHLHFEAWHGGVLTDPLSFIRT